MGWSDDLSPRVARGETLVSLVDYVLDSERVERPWQEVRDVLVERFALSYDHARLTVAAVKRGKAHAATASPMNERDRAENPIAWIADQRARDRPVEVPRVDLRAGQCHARVGEVTLDRIRSARVEGDDADAAGLCEAVVVDFAVVVDRCEAMSAAPFDEHRMALEDLRAALDELTAIRGELAPGAASLRTRCVALLARCAMEQVGPRAVLLSRIAAGLREHFTEAAGDARVQGDTVLAATDRLRIEVEPDKLNDTGSRATAENITFTPVVSAGGSAVASVRRPGSAVPEAGKPSLLRRKQLLLLMLAIAIVVAWWILA